MEEEKTASSSLNEATGGDSVNQATGGDSVNQATGSNSVNQATNEVLEIGNIEPPLISDYSLDMDIELPFGKELELAKPVLTKLEKGCGEWGTAFFTKAEVYVSSPQPGAWWIIARSGTSGQEDGYLLSAFYHPFKKHSTITTGKLRNKHSVANAGKWAISIQTKAESSNSARAQVVENKEKILDELEDHGLNTISEEAVKAADEYAVMLSKGRDRIEDTFEYGSVISVSSPHPHPGSLWISTRSGTTFNLDGSVSSAYYHPYKKHFAITEGKQGRIENYAAAGEWAISIQPKAEIDNKALYNTDN